MRIEVHKSIVDVQETWDRLAPRNRVTLESEHLLAIERSGVNAIDPYYLVAHDGARAAGIIHGFVMRLDVASIDRSVPPGPLSTLRTWNPDFLNQPVFECGIVSGLGEAIAAADADRPGVCRAAAAEMVRLAREAGAEFVLVRDVPFARLGEYSGFLDEGYAPLLGFPIAKMDVRWASFEDYLAALKSHTRQDVRRPLAHQPADLEVALVPDFAAHADRLAALWEATSRRAADYTHEKLNAAYFREIQRCLPDRSRVMAVRRHDEIVAFALCLVGDEDYFAVHCGVDYDSAEGDNLYDLLMVSLLRDAFGQQRRTLNWGITTYDYKFKRGFEADPVLYLIKHARQAHLTPALARGLQKGIHHPLNTHRPFRDQDVSARPDFKAIAASLPVTGAPLATDILAKAQTYDRTESLRLGGLYAFCPAFETAQGPVVLRNGREVVMLGSNAYLGLATHPEVLAASKAAIDKYGTGCSGSPLLNGTLDIHEELAAALAEFMGKEEVLLCSTGYQTNVGVVSALAAKDDIIIMDRLDHASLVDGARLSGVDIVRFRHNDMSALERALKSHPGRGKLVVVDSVFSMEGTIANLPTIIELAKKYGARTMVDEAHAIGVLGPGGRGAAEHFGLLGDVDVVMGTFSKSFASIGGFVATDRRTVDYLRHTARAHIFSASLPPAAIAAARTALEIIKHEPERRARVIRNAAYMSSRLRALGYDAPFHHTAVVPVRCNNDALTMGAFKRLLEKGVFVNPVLEPAVPKGSEMLRTSYMATHTQEMLDRALKVFAEVRTPSFPARIAVRPRAAQPAWKVRPMVFLPIADRHSLARYYATDRQEAVLRIPGFTRLEIGQPVDCGISFGAEGIILQSQGLVAAKSFSDSGGRPAGIEVQLLPAQSPARDLIEKLMDAGVMEPLPARRQTWRYHAGIEVEYAIAHAVCTGSIDDISVGGASVLGDACPALGTRLPMLLKAPPLEAIEVMAEVRWQRDGHEPGFGVTFIFKSNDQRERVAELVDRIKSTSAEMRPMIMSVQ